HVQLNVDIAAAEHLDPLALTEQAATRQFGLPDRSAVRERPGDIADIDRLVLDAGRVFEPTQLREPHLQRQLATFEPGWHVLACSGALHTAASCLAPRAPLAPA